MKTYPMKFNVTSESTFGVNTLWQGTAVNQTSPITLAIPPEFEGPGGGFSPEDLYALALENCFIATFKVFAEKSRLTYEKIIVAATLAVDRNEKGSPWMAHINLNIKLIGTIQKENAQRILEKVSANCMILNSVKTEKSFSFEIE